MINGIERSEYIITEKPALMKSRISLIAHLTPNLPDEEYARIKRIAVSELYDIFEKYT